MWGQLQQVTAEWNRHRSSIVDLLSFWHTSTGLAVSQGESTASFEESTEYGEPEGLRPPSQYALLGFDFRDYDRAARFTWKALRDMDARQVRAFHNEALNADNKLVTGSILRRLFDPEEHSTPEGLTSYGLWSGTGDMFPPPFRGKTFDTSHTHYLATGSDTIDSADLEEGVKNLREHGYGLLDSTQKILLLSNESESEEVQSFRAGQETADGVVAKWDFIPAATQPAFVLQDAGQIVGEQPSGTVFNLASVGSYGPIFVVESSFIPDGYFTLVATSGPGSPSNPVGVREHANAVYRGLRHLPGRDLRYPLIESFYTRAFGTGTAQRGSAVCYQLTEDAEYTAPDTIAI